MLFPRWVGWTRFFRVELGGLEAELFADFFADAVFVGECKDGATFRIFSQPGTNLIMQTVETSTHVAGFHRHEHFPADGGCESASVNAARSIIEEIKASVTSSLNLWKTPCSRNLRQKHLAKTARYPAPSDGTNYKVLQEMKESTTIDDYEYRKIQEAEVAEELALRSALKRVSLEEAAKSPSISKYQWISYAVTGAVLIYFHEHLANYIWYIVIFLLIEIRTSSAAVHSRIDAILELERLRLETQREEQKKSATSRDS